MYDCLHVLSVDVFTVVLHFVVVSLLTVTVSCPKYSCISQCCSSVDVTPPAPSAQNKVGPVLSYTALASQGVCVGGRIRKERKWAISS